MYDTTQPGNGLLACCDVCDKNRVPFSCESSHDKNSNRTGPLIDDEEDDLLGDDNPKRQKTVKDATVKSKCHLSNHNLSQLEYKSPVAAFPTPSLLY